jgi:hypothetical protein
MQRPFLVFIILIGVVQATLTQSMNRIPIDGQPLFLNGGNIAWIHFARDIGPGTTRLDLFEQIFREVNEHGGNTMRLWLHTTGAVTPEWNGHKVTGPGEGAIEDLRDILDLAYKHNVSVMLCLWSFDMLRISNGPQVTERALAILTEEEKTKTYIANTLVPMVHALKGHPAIVAWEIFNEAEGMSFEFGWEFTKHIPMHYIQKFVNLTAGAIRRTDPGARITNGAWSFRVLSEKAPMQKSEGEPTGTRRSSDGLTIAELKALNLYISDKYKRVFTLEETAEYYDEHQNSGEHINYYSDTELIEAGGDPLGYLDFYTVHYYTWGGTNISPFHHDFSYWGLDKPTAVTEFYVEDMFNVPMKDLYLVLYERGYAGALGWQWFDHWADREGISHNWPNALRNMRNVFDLHREEVELKFRTQLDR